MTDVEIIQKSYAAERSYSHNLDDIIDVSNAVLAIGNTKKSTTELADLSGNGNDGDVNGAMPSNEFFMGRRFDGIDDCVNCGNGDSLDITNSELSYCVIFKPKNLTGYHCLFTIYGSMDNAKIGIWTSDSNIYMEISTNGRLDSLSGVVADSTVELNKFNLIMLYRNSSNVVYAELNGSLYTLGVIDGNFSDWTRDFIIGEHDGTQQFDGVIAFISQYSTSFNAFNALARLPFWSVNFTDYPDNVAEYTDNLPYSSAVIQSGIFRVDNDKLQCVSAGTMTYSTSYKFDGSEYITVAIDSVEYAGTGTITHGGITVSIAQDSNKITVAMGAGDAIDKIDIQFRAEV